MQTQTTDILDQILQLELKAKRKKERFERDYKNLTDEISRLRSSLDPELPESLKCYFGSHRAVIFDAICGEPVAWGYKPNQRLRDELWSEAGKIGNWECIDMSNWVLVTRHLTPKEAVAKYGNVTEVKVGPRGGWKHATYGDKTFCVRELDPRGKVDHPTPQTERV